MYETIQSILQALNNSLKSPRFKVTVTIAPTGYKTPIMVYYNLEYTDKDGRAGIVMSTGIDQEQLKESDLTRIKDELLEKYRGREND